MESFTNPVLEAELQQEIQKIGIIKTFRPNDILIREGQFISAFPVLLKGLVRITRNNDNGNELLLYYLKKNEVCAMSLTCCMTSLTSTINAVAETETDVIMLPVEVLDTWICKYPGWKQFVMQSFQMRFRELIDTIDSIAFLNLEERLIKYFTSRIKQTGITGLNETHQELAMRLNTSREVVSRLLKKLEKKGKIKLSRNYIDFSNLV